jgi:Domain of unknown function (DUF5666)
MPKKIKDIRVLGFVLVLLAALVQPAFSKGSDIQFQGTVSRVDFASPTNSSITLRVMGFDVVVKVTADTDVDFHGDEAELSDIKVGDFVKVNGFFMNSGITAKEIDIVDRGDGEFRLRGLITAVRPVTGGTLITVLGVDILVNPDTKVERRGPTAGFTAADLAVNQNADARGFHRDGQFIATRVKVGNRDEDAIRVHFEGKITAVVPGRLTVDTEGGSSAIVLITSTTIVTGTPEVGKFVEVHGTLNSSLQVVASRIQVRSTRDDDEPSRPISKFEKKISILPVGAVSSVRGESEVELEQQGTVVEQQFEIEFKNAQVNTDYSVRVEVAGAGAVTLGTAHTNREGQAEMHLKSPARPGQPDLAALLPAGKTVRDITKVQILTTGGVVVAEGTF